MSHPLADAKYPTTDAQQGLREVAHDMEEILHKLGDVAGDQADELKGKARSALDSLRDIEQRTQARLQAAGHETQQFVHENPWAVIAVAALSAYVLGFLTRPRR